LRLTQLKKTVFLIFFDWEAGLTAKLRERAYEGNAMPGFLSALMEEVYLAA